MQTPVSQLTANDVSRLTKLRDRAVENANSSRVEAIDDRLRRFVVNLNLPSEPLIDDEFDAPAVTKSSRGERIARTAVGLVCGAGIGFVMTGLEGILAGAAIGYVLVSQFRSPGVFARD